MARSRRALLRKGNVTDIAEARKKREEKQQAREQALANARIGTLEEASRHADAIQAAIAAEATNAQALCASASGAGLNQVSGQVAAGSASTGTGTSSTASSGTGGSMVSAQCHQSAGSAPTAETAQPAPQPSAAAAPPAHWREHQQIDPEAARKKARADKKNANRTFNREKVDAIKKAIANGTYQINATRTADKFIERESCS